MMRRRVGGRGVVGGRSVSAGGSGVSRGVSRGAGGVVSRGVGLVVVGLVGLVVPVGVGLVLGTTGVAVAQETPEQRCARETAQWDAAQLALWQATHPGQSVPSPGPWPAYVCVGGPDVDVDVDADVDASVSGRADRWGGESIAGDGVGVSQNGQDVGVPRTGISRGGSAQSAQSAQSGQSALESARSNVTVPVSQVEVGGC